ncbi:MAG: nucleoside monophosphate kinase [bacterium]|nr:nucleoside monophosphate kinase [bacterium]
MKRFTFLFVGPPGSGKGTQAEAVADSLGLPHVDVGALLRELADLDNNTGRLIKSLMIAGKTVPEEVVLEELLVHLKMLDLSKGLVLDGYCRTQKQAKDLLNLQTQGVIPPIVVISIKVDDNLLQERITTRKYCELRNGEKKNIDNSFSVIDCQQQGGHISKRADDNLTTFHERLKLYHEQTEPAIADLKETSKGLIMVDGTPPIKSVEATIAQQIQHL